MEDNRADSGDELLLTLIQGLAKEREGAKALFGTLGELGDPALMDAAFKAGVFTPTMQHEAEAYLAVKKFFANAADSNLALPIAQKVLRAMDADGSLAAILVKSSPTMLMSMSMLLDLGADPNEVLPASHWRGKGCVTALRYYFCNENASEKIWTMLNHLIDEDRLPIGRHLPGAKPVSFFDEFLCPLDTFNSTRVMELMSDILAMDLPHSWQLEMGAALGRAMEKYGDKFPAFQMDAVAASMAPRAIMSAESWLRLMSMKNSDGATFATRISESDDWKEMKTVVENMIRDGVDPDKVTAILPPMRNQDGTIDNTAPLALGTLLQAAVARGNALIVEPLLAHGADPRPKIHLGGGGDSTAMDCFEIAEMFDHESVSRLLLAWCARDAINVVLDRAKLDRHQRLA